MISGSPEHSGNQTALLPQIRTGSAAFRLWSKTRYYWIKVKSIAGPLSAVTKVGGAYELSCSEPLGGDMLVFFHNGCHCKHMQIFKGRTSKAKNTGGRSLASRGSKVTKVFNSTRSAGHQNIKHCGSRKRLTLADISPK